MNFGIEILKSSPYTTIQDSGRFGFTHLGFSNSGAMDMYAYNLSNKLLENSMNCSSLEIMWGGLKIKSHVNSSFVITGAKFRVKLNSLEINLYETYEIKRGDILEFFEKSDGVYAYLTFKDGFSIKKELGSSSTSLKEKIGGLNSGELIKKSDFLPLNKNVSFTKRSYSKSLIPTYGNSLILRVIESYQNSYFEQKEKEKFYSSVYHVTKEFNKMAYKLDGEAISAKSSDIISEGIAYGSIQIPANGKPIILLNERQTVGGYVKFGVVFSLDCYKLSQMVEGSEIGFNKISLEEAKLNLKKFKEYFS